MLRRRYVVCLVKCPSLLNDRNQNYTIVANAQKVIGLQLQIDPMNRRRDASKKVLCISSKVRFVIERSQPNLYQMCRLQRD
jgi:hypothetical protein